MKINMANDNRDKIKWVAVELSYHGETKVDNGTIVKTLRKDLGVRSDFPIFVPATTYLKNGKPVTLHVMQGYVFVGTGLPSTKYFALENQPYVNRILSEEGSNNMRALSVVDDSHICSLKKKMRVKSTSGLCGDTYVDIIAGLYENMEGKILSVSGDNATVHIKLRSIEVVTDLPKIFLEARIDQEAARNEIEFQAPPKRPLEKVNIKKNHSYKLKVDLPEEIPTSSFFNDAILIAIGVKSGLKAEVGVPMDVLMNTTLDCLSISPEEKGWPVEGRDGLHRKIHYAFRNQREGYIGKNKKPYTVLKSPGIWALTHEGLNRCKQLIQRYEVEIND